MSLAELLCKSYEEVCGFSAIEILRWRIWASYQEKKREREKAGG